MEFIEVLESLIEYVCLKYLVHTSKWRVELLLFQFRIWWGPTSICHLFRPSVYPSVCRVPYPRNHTSPKHYIWYTCVKWWYLYALFSFFLKFWFFRLLGGRGGWGARAKNSPKWKIMTSAMHHISSIWSWFLVHLCKMIFPGVFFF